MLGEISPACDGLFTSSQGELMISVAGIKLSSRTVLYAFSKSILLETMAQFRVLRLQINSVRQLKENHGPK